MQIWLTKRGYPDNIVENKMNIKLTLVKAEVKPNLPQECLSFLRITPRLKALGKIVHENLNLLYMNGEVKNSFTPGSMVPFRTP